jgi:hypothetical protein
MIIHHWQHTGAQRVPVDAAEARIGGSDVVRLYVFRLLYVTAIDITSPITPVKRPTEGYPACRL